VFLSQEPPAAQLLGAAASAQLSDEQVAELFKQADADGDGKITPEEFADVLPPAGAGVGGAFWPICAGVLFNHSLDILATL
jgi:hypothetical protein